MVGIYKITSPTGKVYVGKSRRIIERLLEHFRNGNSAKKLRSSMKEFGSDTHKFDIIELCSNDKLNERERYWQIFYNVTGENGLNSQLTSVGPNKNKKIIKTYDNFKYKIINNDSGEIYNDIYVLSQLINIPVTRLIRKLLAKETNNTPYSIYNG